MFCPQCGTENEAGLRFCDECGSALGGLPGVRGAQAADGQVLRRVRHALSPGAAATAAAARHTSPSRPPAPVAERRLVSVLFADLVGFTTLAEGRDAEEIRETPDPLLRPRARRHRPVRRHGREVHRRRGDGRLGRAGRPRGRRGARRPGGARAGRRRPGAGPGHRGPSRRPDRRGGRDDRRDEPGDGRRRPRQHGQPAPVRRRRREPCWSARRPSAPRREAIAFEPAGEQALKGKAAPVPAWRAVRVVAERGGATGAETWRRRSSVATTSCACSRTCSTPRRASSGPGSCRSSGRRGSARPGWRGSSASTSTAWSSTVWWHDGRSPAYGDGISFWALGEMVRAPGRAARDRRRAHDAGRIAETVVEHVADPDERRWIEPALLALLGIEPAGSPATQLFAAWRTFFERLAGTAPVVMVFEDFHYADSGLIDFVDHLLEWSRALPDLRGHARAGPSCWSGVRTGAPASGASRRCSSSRSRRPAMRSCSRASCPACRTRRWRRSSPAPTASRCTRSRPSACSSPRASCASRTASTARPAT